MTYPTGWTQHEPCPSFGSPDVLECEIRVNVDQVRLSWECRDCGHATTWMTSAKSRAGHVAERRIVTVMPLHAVTAV